MELKMEKKDSKGEMKKYRQKRLKKEGPTFCCSFLSTHPHSFPCHKLVGEIKNYIQAVFSILYRHPFPIERPCLLLP